MKEKIERLKSLNRQAELGGGEARIAKQHAGGKLSARERVELLLEKGTFVENLFQAEVFFFFSWILCGIVTHAICESSNAAPSTQTTQTPRLTHTTS